MATENFFRELTAVPLNTLYRTLELPMIYRLVQRLALLFSGERFNLVMREVFGISNGRILDVGCGPLLVSPQPAGLLIGLDINCHYIESFLKNCAGQGNCAGLVADARQLPFVAESFDEVRMVFVLHHLSDAEAQAFFNEALRVLAPSGCLRIFDALSSKGLMRNPFNFFLRRLDRGHFFRSKEELTDLVMQSGGNVKIIGLYQYSKFGLEGMGFEVRKS